MKTVTVGTDGATVAIGSAFHDKQNATDGSNAGHVRVLDYSATTNMWTQRGSPMEGRAGGDKLGMSVSVSSGKWRCCDFVWTWPKLHFA